jgi:hypothetical protein
MQHAGGAQPVNSFANGKHRDRHADRPGQHRSERLDAEQQRENRGDQKPNRLNGRGPRRLSTMRSPPLQAELP